METAGQARTARLDPFWAGRTRYVTTRAVDGFDIVPHLLPSSVTDIVDKLVPELRSRGVYPTEYLDLPPLTAAAVPVTP
ncbi:hypothetical protein [Streptomyces geranii]|uniref:hypothetical protein n=1 Tax=Streptomyces geranii TaxID=2058923 RepID=UPI0018E504D4|nr:hypothetical protein [Streptomyces geranii]